jgi:uncharacterized RDD family membrane protein YckC
VTDGAAATGSAPTAGPVPAPLRVRTPAFLLDQLVVTLLVVVPALALGYRAELLTTPERTWAFLAAMAVAFLYHLFAEWLTGTTLGKRALGLRVTGDDGTPLSFRGSFLRNALRLIDGLGYWSVAVAVIVYRGDGKRLGDWAGGTLVVRA